MNPFSCVIIRSSDDHLDDILNATTVVVANPGCLLQTRIGIERAGLKGKVRAVHIVDLLAEALRDPIEL